MTGSTMQRPMSSAGPNMQSPMSCSPTYARHGAIHCSSMDSSIHTSNSLADVSEGLTSRMPRIGGSSSHRQTVSRARAVALEVDEADEGGCMCMCMA
eukprot:CAMPEP_0185409126 /NCGR_PEP_ID=MMETSP1365-20130426/2332_1 /TAXON_ID=38817 /ORGANISM="Gephyrocapsa oceanica, Strain RCC1303" /LENGTH=96 /DNA_ID=CAMNT_0028011683 /DNA_START=536 /DNA_END=826 /DNA_ORIENTATION=-